MRFGVEGKAGSFFVSRVSGLVKRSVNKKANRQLRVLHRS